MKKIKYIVTTTDLHAKQIIHRIFRVMHLPLSIIMRDFGTCIHVHHSSAFVNENLSAAKICSHRGKHVSFNDLQPYAELSKVAK